MNQNIQKKIFIGVAWPYANGEQHIGHIAGAYLPSDVFARFHRMCGNQVLMVSGSDTHGTPITVRADEEKISPRDVVNRYHPLFIDCYLKIGLTFDLFTHTDTENHWQVTHDMFQVHLKKGYLYKDKQKQIYDVEAKKFLPDRYVEGECPFCGFQDARGDQCDNCGKTYDAVDLKNPRSKMSGHKNLEVKETEHFFIDLGKLNDLLLEWVTQVNQDQHWRANVFNYTKTQLEMKELRGRPITRDMEWGITVPITGFESKRIYVWYEAVMGYLSAAKEWASLQKTPEAWKDFWDATKENNTQSYYFIGKDNIPFHAIMWPAMLIGYGGLLLPFDVPANEYLNMYGRKFSKSRGHVIGISDVLNRYQVDAWRYALIAMAPEGMDVDFTWDDFLEKVNNELVANWGNLVNRVLGFTYKKCDGKIPNQHQLQEVDEKLFSDLKEGFSRVTKLYSQVKLRQALNETMRLSQRVNQYLNEHAPWTLMKTDSKRAESVLFVAIQCIDWLKVMFSPVLIESTQKIHEMLGYEGEWSGKQFTEMVKDRHGEHLVLRYDNQQAQGVWELNNLKENQSLKEPGPLFIKLDPKEVEKEVKI